MDYCQEFPEQTGFFKKYVGAGFLEFFAFRLRTQADDESVGAPASKGPHDIRSVSSGHVVISNDHIEAPLLRQFKSRPSVVATSHFEAVGFQHISKEAADCFVVIHHKNSFSHQHIRSATVKKPVFLYNPE